MSGQTSRRNDSDSRLFSRSRAIAAEKNRGSGRGACSVELILEWYGIPRRDQEQARFVPAWLVVDPLRSGHEPPAATLGEQHDQVDRGKTETAHDHVLTGGNPTGVGIRGECGRQVEQRVLPCEVDELGMFGFRGRASVAERVEHEIDVEALVVVEHHPLPAIGQLVDPHRGPRMHDHLTTGARELGDRVPGEPGEVRALQAPGGE